MVIEKMCKFNSFDVTFRDYEVCLLVTLQVPQLLVLLGRSVQICGLGLPVQPMLLLSVTLEFKSSPFCGYSSSYHFWYPGVIVLIYYLFERFDAILLRLRRIRSSWRNYLIIIPHGCLWWFITCIHLKFFGLRIRLFNFNVGSY